MYLINIQVGKYFLNKALFPKEIFIRRTPHVGDTWKILFFAKRRHNWNLAQFGRLKSIDIFSVIMLTN